MKSLEDVIEAYQAISDAEQRYREVLREALQSGTQQVAISAALGRTREMIRRDAMSDEQRDELRRLDTERRRTRRTKQAVKD